MTSPAPDPTALLRARERTIVLLIAAVQFVNVLDFVMVMPLGTFFSKSLSVPPNQMGHIGGAYTGAAAVAGLAGSFFLDRYDRRKALALAMIGLMAGTALGGFAVGLRSLVAARIVAGLFGGPATSLSISIIADVVPPERRGNAMAIVMAGFSVAQVLGVPMGLWVADKAGWQAPFFSVAGLGLLIACMAVWRLPPMTLHLKQGGHERLPYFALFERPIVLFSYSMTAVQMAAGFLVIPNLPAFVVNNLGVPKESLYAYYCIGGLTSIVSIQLAGRLVDRLGSFRVGVMGAGAIAAVMYLFFIVQPRWPVVLFFVCFMLALSFRNVACSTLATKVPRPMERARFQSLQSTVQHLASALGSETSSMLLSTSPSGQLVGLSSMASAAIGLSLVLPALIWRVERLMTAAPATAGSGVA